VNSGKGSLITTNGTAATALAVGTNGQYLVADSAASNGIKWAAAAAASFAGAVVYNSAAQTLSNNTLTAITWNSEDIDTNGFHSTSTNTSRITVPTGYAGKYLVGAVLNWDQSNGTGERTTLFYKNGSAVASSAAGLGAGGVPSATYPLGFSFVVDCAVNDYLEVYGKQTSGGNLSVNGNASGTRLSHFWAIYLGA
jgi:hypothetical protein